MEDTRYKDTYKLAIEDLKDKVFVVADKNISDLKREAYLNGIYDTLEFLDKCIQADLQDDINQINTLKKELKGL